MKPELMRLKDFCIFYGLNIHTVRTGLKRNPSQYPPVFKVGGLIFFKTQEIEKWGMK